MKPQFITTEAGRRLVVLDETEYQALVEAAEDESDRTALHRHRAARKAGKEEAIPSEIVKRLVKGENPIRVWREHRGMTARALAEKARLASAYVSQIENGAREGSLETIRKLADALGVTIDDLAG